MFTHIELYYLINFINKLLYIMNTAVTILGMFCFNAKYIPYQLNFDILILNLTFLHKEDHSNDLNSTTFHHNHQ